MNTIIIKDLLLLHGLDFLYEESFSENGRIKDNYRDEIFSYINLNNNESMMTEFIHTWTFHNTDRHIEALKRMIQSLGVVKLQGIYHTILPEYRERLFPRTDYSGVKCGAYMQTNNGIHIVLLFNECLYEFVQWNERIGAIPCDINDIAIPVQTVDAKFFTYIENSRITVKEFQKNYSIFPHDYMFSLTTIRFGSLGDIKR